MLRAMGDPEAVYVDGANVGECLDDLVRQYPAAEPLLFDKRHNVFNHMLVFVNAESLKKVELAKPVRQGDTIIIATLFSAG